VTEVAKTGLNTHKTVLKAW